MSKKRKTWTADEKLAILQEAEQAGVTATIRKHGIYSNTFYQWREKLQTQGKEALANPYQKTNPELKRLQVENLRLKQLLAEKELALQIKDELLKKSLSRPKLSS
ncbi:hypothetical protein GCM10023187_57760 [Nibrella viscosa]|uniref:Transposase n=1 Tax=Nibrella viscosa TaxID=1084524 RepID=A0ABP8L5E6_9BACT